MKGRGGEEREEERCGGSEGKGRGGERREGDKGAGPWRCLVLGAAAPTGLRRLEL